MKSIDEWLFPRVLSLVGRVHEPRVKGYKERFLRNIGGKILEIGPGNGVNFGYYSTGAALTVAEPNGAMHRTLHDTAHRYGLDFDARTDFAETLSLPDESFDTVVSTLVLCSVRDLGDALRQTLRVLRPGGRFVFLEHVAAPQGSLLRTVQTFVKPAWSCMGGGCRPDREIAGEIERAGFADLSIERFDTGLPVVSPHIAGFAVKGR